MKTRKGWLVKRGKTYHAAWKIGGKLFTKSTGQTDKRNALTRLAEIMEPFLVEDEARTLESVKTRLEGARAELAAIDEARNPPLAVSAAWGVYRGASATADITKGTLRNYEGYWEAFMRWIAEAHPELIELRQVTAAHAEEYWAHLGAQGVTGRTCNAHRAFLRAFWGVLCDLARLATVYTLRDGTQTKNPWATIRPRDEHSVSRRALTVEELRNVCRTAAGELRTMLALGLYLGARMGDAACMDWGNVDMARRLIRFTPRKTSRKVKDVLAVPMHPELYAVLSETPPDKRRGPVCPELATRYTEKGQGPVSAIVQRHFEACGLTTTTERTGAGQRRAVSAGFHSLRHSAVSLLREAGAAQSVSMALVGHNSADVHNLYTHTDEGAMRRAVASLPSVMGDEPKALPPAEPATEIRARVKAIAEGMTAKTWKAARAELLALAGETRHNEAALA
jgi:integrase